jgi:hypothetical protein
MTRTNLETVNLVLSFNMIKPTNLTKVPKQDNQNQLKSPMCEGGEP